jgi:hypothetical protein
MINLLPGLQVRQQLILFADYIPDTGSFNANKPEGAYRIANGAAIPLYETSTGSDPERKLDFVKNVIYTGVCK